MANKNIIVGMNTLSEIRDKGGIYVDKTRYIDYLENNAGTSVPVLLRPRRFGKSLTANMLHCYYDISEKSKFEKNFKGTWIYDHITPLANSYYVIHFDFSDVSSVPAEVNFTFLCSVASSIIEFSKRYPDKGLSREQLDPSLYKTASDLLLLFLNNFSTNANDGEYLRRIRITSV